MRVLKREGIKSVIISISILTAVFSVTFIGVLSIQYNNYNKVVNKTVNSIINNIKDKYPEVSDNEIIDILNKPYDKENNILARYGYDEDILFIAENRENVKKNIVINIVIFIMFSVTALYIYIKYTLKKEKKIDEINKYIKAINNKDYTLNIEDNGEGELSKLKNELYKITVSLKETAENSQKEKERLNDSITDISHQLKTPLTSIRIMLDNIEENPEMDEQTRAEFIKEISKQIDWISSLVISLLKLSKFDAGAVVMNREKISVEELISKVIDNLAILIDIKNIEIIKEVPEGSNFIGDYKWELEAFTNIVKNAIEHSSTGSKIYVQVEDNSLFLKITIKDEGEGIDKKDLRHIFERFYKNRQAGDGSIGVGLPIAKAIIDKDNGYISVDSELNYGTTFEVKFMK